MYPREATQRMVGLIRSGLVRLEEFAVTEFPLAKVNEAVAPRGRQHRPLQDDGGPALSSAVIPSEVEGSFRSVLRQMRLSRALHFVSLPALVGMTEGIGPKGNIRLVFHKMWEP